MLAAERPHGSFSRQLFLGDTLDVDAMQADYTDGVLTLRIPVAERAKPRKVTINAQRRAPRSRHRRARRRASTPELPTPLSRGPRAAAEVDRPRCRSEDEDL